MYYKRLKDMRTDSDLTQQQIADILHCHRLVYQKYENGVRSVPVDILVTLSNFYGTSVDYLIERTDSKKPYEKKSQPSANRESGL